jgi:ribose 5-phosphate isomerase B
MSASVIAIASDHGGYELKNILKEVITAAGCEVLDIGTHNEASVDYPDFANALAKVIREGKAARGVLLCGTGIGMSIAANRHVELRAALVHDAFGARLCRQHNDANVLCMGGRSIGSEVAKDCLRIFLSTEFEGGRHARRVEKLNVCR